MQQHESHDAEWTARMSTYAIGDLQGCFDTLQALLKRLRFDARHDTLWFVGDLVNRGAGSLECLRFIVALGNRAVVTLGNHDLHLLAVAEGLAKPKALDTLDAILDAPDRNNLLLWLRQQKLLHVTPTWAMVHAGLMPQWSWAKAQALAREVETALRSNHYRDVLKHMYGNEPATWRDNLNVRERQRFVINTMTRMRTLDDSLALDLRFKGELTQMPSHLQAWFTKPNVRRSARITIAGHWSALGLARHDKTAARFIGLDTGCIWGGSLTALRLEDRKIFQQPCVEKTPLEGWD
jgi:bis(5'-nucleosyl)-tetraphosphatase (symmetrical)